VGVLTAAQVRAAEEAEEAEPEPAEAAETRAEEAGAAAGAGPGAKAKAKAQEAAGGDGAAAQVPAAAPAAVCGVRFSFPGMPDRDSPSGDGGEPRSDGLGLLEGLLPHHRQGRVVVAAFPSFTLLCTYAPCVSAPHRPTSRERKRDWNQAVGQYVARLRARGRSVVWTGDLNACLGPDDVTHPRWFREQYWGTKTAPRLIHTPVGVDRRPARPR
jgi:exonuclease III